VFDWYDLWGGVIMFNIISQGVLRVLGSGTSADPYQIRTPAQLAFIRDKVNEGDANYNAKALVQTAHLDLSAYANWVPIGGATNRFYGVYDGNGLEIRGLNTSQNRAGLFGTVENATLKNIVISCINCTIVSTASNNAWVGAVAAAVYGTTNITGCINYSTITNNGNSGNCFAGGIVGYNNMGAGNGVSNCANYGAVAQNATTTGQKFGGGIAGLKSTNASVTSCFNSGAVTTSSGTVQAISINASGNVTTCYYDSDTSLAGGQTGATGRTTANSQGTDALTNANKLSDLGTTSWKAQGANKYPVPVRTFI